MAIALVTSVTAAAGNTFTTGAVDTTGSTLLIATQSSYAFSGEVGTLSDSKVGNTWNPLTAYGAGGGTLPRVRISWCVPVSVGSGHTFTSTGTTIAEVLTVSAWSGGAASPQDQQNGTVTFTTSLAPGSVTPVESNELIVSALAWDNPAGSSVAIDSGFTILHQTAYNAGVNVGGAHAYFVQGAAAAINPTWSWTTAINASTAIATFKAAAAGPRFILGTH